VEGEELNWAGLVDEEEERERTTSFRELELEESRSEKA